VAATVVLPGPAPSSYTLWLSIAAGGRLAVLPEPTVVAAGARHHTAVEATVEAGGALVLREEVLLGRSGEPGGALRSLLRVDVAGVPLLRHELTLDGADPDTLAPAGMVGARGTGTLLSVDPQWTDEATRPAGWATAHAAGLPLAGPGLLVTALATDALTLRRRLTARPGRSAGG
jgi:urease accessory protein